MKNFLLSILIIFVFTGNGIASEIVQITDHIDENHNRISYRTTKEILGKCPDWKLDKEPPLPVSTATEIANTWIKKKYPKFNKFSIAAITLSKIWDREYQNKWYYSISVNAFADIDGINTRSFFSVIILMDGSVVEPIAQCKE